MPTAMSSQKNFPTAEYGIRRKRFELSGGERQRISDARCLFKGCTIILLDEATASLDVDNETMIQESLSRLIKDKTVMIIAHRMRTVANADKIVVLKDGVIAESGTQSELGCERRYLCQYGEDAEPCCGLGTVEAEYEKLHRIEMYELAQHFLSYRKNFCGYGVEDEDEGCPHCWIKKKI